MREIKLRAFQDGMMNTQKNSGVYATKAFLDMLYEDCELMQFTGLLDKDGKEIYEGDIVQTGDMYGSYKGKIEWWGDRWTLNYMHAGESCNQALMTLSLPEVIGNIYKNPELLER